MFRRNKQKGFISAEIGIGILIISLLTILGFLAATDLDDEITRSPSDVLTNATAVHSLITAAQEAVDQRSFEDRATDLLNSIDYKTASYNEQRTMIDKEFNISRKVWKMSDEPYRLPHSPGNSKLYWSTTADPDNGLTLIFGAGETNISLAFYCEYYACDRLIAELNEQMPDMGFKKLGSAMDHKLILSISIKKGENWDEKEVMRTPSLQDTWMSRL